MYRPSRRQTSMLESRFLVPPKKRARLERSWAEVFRTRVLPLIDEEPFRGCFHASVGRPNKSIRLLVGVHILKEAEDLTDEQVLEQLEFNLLWHHALGVEPEESHLCQKTLHNFRTLLLEDERAREVFDQVTRAMVEMDGLSVVRQRLDSTHVLSNMAVLTRLGLFVETVTKFLKALRREHPDRLAVLNPGYQKRYLEREGYFSDAKRGQAKRRLPVVARDMYHLVQAFEGDKAVGELEAHALLVRLFGEQCEVVDESSGEESLPTVRLREGREISSDSLQSPHDPDATYGHKGKGYEAQITETCVDDNEYQVITDVDVHGSNVSDQHAVVPVVERLSSKGLSPDELVADTNYGSGKNIVACAEQGVSLFAPVQDPDKTPGEDGWSEPVEGERDASPPESSAATEERLTEGMGLEAFEFSADFWKVTSCPAGHAPMRHRRTHHGKRVVAMFHRSSCEACPMSPQCPTQRRVSGSRELRYRPERAATSTRQREQQTTSFKEAYKIRSGIEATNSVLKGRHGADGLRVRGEARVKSALLFKSLALNARRCMRHHLERLRGDVCLQVDTMLKSGTLQASISPSLG